MDWINIVTGLSNLMQVLLSLVMIILAFYTIRIADRTILAGKFQFAISRLARSAMVTTRWLLFVVLIVVVIMATLAINAQHRILYGHSLAVHIACIYVWPDQSYCRGMADQPNLFGEGAPPSDNLEDSVNGSPSDENESAVVSDERRNWLEPKDIRPEEYRGDARSIGDVSMEVYERGDDPFTPPPADLAELTLEPILPGNKAGAE